MALRDQPYLPLFIKDIMTDAELNECCASTHGIYIKGIMCLMHKSSEYGKILLKQKYKQNLSMELNFATQLQKHLPYTVKEIEEAIVELIREKVCFLEGDFLCQKRMIKDHDISLKRSKAGKTGADNKKFANTKRKANTKAKAKANTAYAYVNEIVNKDIYRSFAHLKIYNEEYLKLVDLGYSKIEIDNILDRIENYKRNTKYTSLFLTAKNWLSDEKEKVKKSKLDENIEQFNRIP